LHIFQIAFSDGVHGKLKPPETVLMGPPGLKNILFANDRFEDDWTWTFLSMANIPGHIFRAVTFQESFVNAPLIHKLERVVNGGLGHILRNTVLALKVAVKDVHMGVHHSEELS